MYARIAVPVLSIAVVCGLIFYVSWAIDRNNQRTCRLYELIYQPTPDTPIPKPGTRAGDVRAEIGILLDQYHCNR